MMANLMSDKLTLVMQAWRKRRRNYRLLFGTPHREVRLNWQRKIAAFQPGSIFAYERWEADKYGTQHWSIQILQAALPGDAITRVHGINPGAKILATQSGRTNCKSLLSLFDEFGMRGLIGQVQPCDWPRLSHQLQSGQCPEQIVDDWLGKR